jgi:hypothetical protein
MAETGHVELDGFRLGPQSGVSTRRLVITAVLAGMSPSEANDR